MKASFTPPATVQKQPVVEKKPAKEVQKVERTVQATVGEKIWVHIDKDNEFEKLWKTYEIASISADKKKVFLSDKFSKKIWEVSVTDTLSYDLDHNKGFDNLTRLNYLHEASLLNTLETRFSGNQIYTWFGDTLLSINPYFPIPKLYESEESEQKKREVVDVDDLEREKPHVYSVANRSFYLLQKKRRSQSIIINGDSGAGKTEAAKHVVKQIIKNTATSSDETELEAKEGVSEGKVEVEKLIIESTALLEAFGNSITLRNDNSSRFGRFIQLLFNKECTRIIRMNTKHFLLEKSRIIKHSPGERNFHIFYQLCLTNPLKGDEQGEPSFEGSEEYNYLIPKLNENNYLGKSTNEIDLEGFKKTERTLEKIGLDKESQKDIWRILLSILNVGNLEFVKDEKDKNNTGKCKLTEQSYQYLENVAKLLRVWKMKNNSVKILATQEEEEEEEEKDDEDKGKIKEVKDETKEVREESKEEVESKEEKKEVKEEATKEKVEKEKKVDVKEKKNEVKKEEVKKEESEKDEVQKDEVKGEDAKKEVEEEKKKDEKTESKITETKDTAADEKKEEEKKEESPDTKEVEPKKVLEEVVKKKDNMIFNKEAELSEHNIYKGTHNLENVLLRRVITVNKETTIIALNKQQATDSRDALSKFLYSKLFDYLVDKLNSTFSTTPTSSAADRAISKFIGVLDIFGFEDLENNSFEQLLVNYSNELLQQQFDFFLIESERNLFKSEGVDFPNLKLPSLIKSEKVIFTLQNIVFKYLQEQCLLRSGNDQNFLTNLTLQPKGSKGNKTKVKTLKRKKSKKNLTKVQQTQVTSQAVKVKEERMVVLDWKKSSNFIIKHFAGDVSYSVVGFIDKNRDALVQDLKEILHLTTNPILRSFFPQEQQQQKEVVVTKKQAKTMRNKQKTLKKKQKQKAKPVGKHERQRHLLTTKQTLLTVFEQDMSNLITTLTSTDQSFIRCLKPNKNQSKAEWDVRLIKSQLEYLGILQAIQIHEETYPVRRDFFFIPQKYYTALKADLELDEYDVESEDVEKAKEMMKQILLKVLGDKSEGKLWDIGNSKVFLGNEVLYILDLKLNEKREKTFEGMTELERANYLEDERRKQEKELELARIKQEKDSAEKLLKKQKEINEIEDKLKVKEKEILTKHEEEMKKHQLLFKEKLEANDELRKKEVEEQQEKLKKEREEFERLKEKLKEKERELNKKNLEAKRLIKEKELLREREKKKQKELEQQREFDRIEKEKLRIKQELLEKEREQEKELLKGREDEDSKLALLQEKEKDLETKLLEMKLKEEQLKLKEENQKLKDKLLAKERAKVKKKEKELAKKDEDRMQFETNKLFKKMEKRRQKEMAKLKKKEKKSAMKIQAMVRGYLIRKNYVDFRQRSEPFKEILTEGEQVVFSSIIINKAPTSSKGSKSKKRLMCVTNYRKLMIVDPKSLKIEQKGTFDPEICKVSASGVHGHLNIYLRSDWLATESAEWKIKDLLNDATTWVAVLTTLTSYERYIKHGFYKCLKGRANKRKILILLQTGSLRMEDEAGDYVAGSYKKGGRGKYFNGAFFMLFRRYRKYILTWYATEKDEDIGGKLDLNKKCRVLVPDEGTVNGKLNIFMFCIQRKKNLITFEGKGKRELREWVTILRYAVHQVKLRRFTEKDRMEWKKKERAREREELDTERGSLEYSNSIATPSRQRDTAPRNRSRSRTSRKRETNRTRSTRMSSKKFNRDEYERHVSVSQVSVPQSKYSSMKRSKRPKSVKARKHVESTESRSKYTSTGRKSRKFGTLKRKKSKRGKSAFSAVDFMTTFENADMTSQRNLQALAKKKKD